MPHTSHPADPILDRTLHALRDSQPRAGVEALHRRILAGLEQHQAATPAPRRSIVSWHLPAFALTAAAALLIATTFFIPNLHPHPTPTAEPFAQTHRTPTSEILQASTQSTIQPIVQVKNQATNQATHRVPHISLLRCGPTTMPACAPAATNPLLTEQALLDDLHAPSHPAPPMPLTQDERMLVRAARRTDEVQLAQLETLPRLHHTGPSIADYVHNMLAPLVAAEHIEPTPATETPNP